MANTVIALKKSSVPTAQPTVLANGELAINYADGKLFYKHANGTILPFNTQGGNAFGTINANGTLVVAGSSEAVVSIIAGNNISIVGDAINDRITISATGGGANVAVSTSQIKDLTSNDYVITSVTSVSQVVDSVLMSAAFDKANAANVLAFNTGIGANAYAASIANTIAIAAFNQANVSNTIAIAAFNAANASGGSSSAAAFNKANDANIVASSAFDKANSANVLAFNTGIGANAFTSVTISGANTAVGTGANTYLLSVISGANTAVGAGANAYAASIANTIAIAAYDKANTGGGGYFAGNRDEVGASNYGDIFRVHSNTLTQNVTIYSGNNAICAGPITISGAGTTLTIQTGARVVIA